ncbi:MAG: hypothetical protein B7Y12_02195 [Rhizobiales bacterium 24-66-13]|nr:MAG: hypothetical protein B7Z41_03115 [Rhizobiales bacterium 12-66-7]OYY88831.1 MAG: hypothetical protein B7Y61_01225 [Rhizobiales bacterium 35-66-30]OYZ82825.1 MAG: hypothetical protein B7Y12_02195 [Rhizobiales bacterium 24-66-13]OZB11858.1 MAG: hypothetical protein B7X67_02175 [Rhizobiales bacterium 39-66-18]HQS08716.1 phage tail length tape measure family protein [Xanthobacteraceae bacterium]
MTLKLAVQISADGKQAKAEFASTAAAVDSLGSEAKGVATETQSLIAALNRAAEAANSNTRASQQQTAAMASLLGATERQVSAEQRVTAELGTRRSATVALIGTVNQMAAADRTAAAAAEESPRRQKAAATARTAQSGLNARLGVRTDFGTDARDADITAYGAQLDALRAKYSPLYAAQREYIATLKEVRSAEKAGALSAAEAARAVDGAKASFARQVPSLRARQTTGSSAFSQLRPDQRVGLSYQANDIFTSLASGMNPLVVAAQQGPQITQVFGGIKPTLSAIGSLITPLTVGLGAAGAAAITAGTALDGYLSSTKELETAASSFGQATGAIPRELEAIAQAAATAGDASVSAARAMEAAWLRTGRIGSEQFTGLIGISKNFAATFGLDTASGTAKLGELFADPARGAEQLRQVGLLDGATARLVQRLTEQNKVSQAQSTLLAGLTPRLADAGSATTALGRAAEWAGRQWSNLADSIGRGVDRLLSGGAGSLDAQLAELKTELAKYNEGGGVGAANSFFGSGQRKALENAIADLQEQKRARDKLQAQRGAASKDDALSSDAVGIANQSAANDRLRQQRTLEGEIERLRAGQGKPGQTAEEQADITRALDAKTRALDAVTNAQSRATEMDRLDVQIQQARDPATKADLVARRERLALSGQEISADQLEAEVARARARSLLESSAAASSAARSMLEQSRDQTEQLKLEISLIGQSDAVRARAIATLQVEQQVRAQGIGTSSAAAQKLRQEAIANADLGTTLARQSDAWQTFSQAGQSSLDQLTDAVARNGSSFMTLGETVSSVAGDIASSLLKLAVTNPIKNALFGTNAGTLSDAGGIAGLAGRLLGGVGGGGAAGVGTGWTNVVGGAGGLAVPTLFADGGIMTSAGQIPLRRYSAGGVANSPQLALYGEGKLPEAYVPLPDGRRIPVAMQGGGGQSATQGAMAVNVNVVNNAGAAVTTGPMTREPDGTPSLTVFVDAINQHIQADLESDGPISRGIGGRFGLSAAGGLR